MQTPQPKKCMRSWVCKLPNWGNLKININGSFLRSFDRGGIEGFIKNSYGRVLIQLCKERKVDSAVHAKILELRERLLVAATLRWVSSHYLFKSDSQSLSHGSLDPYRLREGSTICFASVAPFSGQILIGQFLILIDPIMTH